jgi:hypothetical protein
MKMKKSAWIHVWNEKKKRRPMENAKALEGFFE